MELLEHWQCMSRVYTEQGRRLSAAQDAAGAALHPAWEAADLGAVWTLLRIVSLLDDATADSVSTWPQRLCDEFAAACRQPENSSIRARATVVQQLSGSAPLTLSTAWRMREWPGLR